MRKMDNKEPSLIGKVFGDTFSELMDYLHIAICIGHPKSITDWVEEITIRRTLKKCPVEWRTKKIIDAWYYFETLCIRLEE